MDGIKMDLKETGYEAEDWIHLAQERECFIYRITDSYPYFQVLLRDILR